MKRNEILLSPSNIHCRTQLAQNLSPFTPSNPFSFKRPSKKAFKTYPHLSLPPYFSSSDPHLLPLKHRLQRTTSTGSLSKEGTFYNARPYLVGMKGGMTNKYRLPSKHRYRSYVDKRIGRKRRKKGGKGLETESLESLDYSIASIDIDADLEGDEEVGGLNDLEKNVDDNVDSVSTLLSSNGPSLRVDSKNRKQPTQKKKKSTSRPIFTADKEKKMFKRMKEIRSSLRLSEAFERHWDFEVKRHRIVRGEKLNRGDMDVDVEGSAYPNEMGQIDQDVPIWKKCFDEEDFERIEKSDEIIRERHVEWLRMFGDLCYGREGRDDLDFVKFCDGYEGEGDDVNEEEEVEKEEEIENLNEVDEEEARLIKLAINESLAEAKAEPEPEPPAKVEEEEEEEEEEETNALLKKLRELKKDGFKEEELKAAATKYSDPLKGLNELKPAAKSNTNTNTNTNTNKVEEEEEKKSTNPAIIDTLSETKEIEKEAPVSPDTLLKKLRELKKDGFKEEALKAAITKYSDPLKGLNELKPQEESKKSRSLQFPPFACFEIVGAGLALGSAISAVAHMPLEKRAKVKTINLDGCLSLTEQAFVELLSVLPNLMNLRCGGLTCIGNDGCTAIGRCKRLRYLDLSNATTLSDEGVKTMTEEMKANGINSIRKLSVANAGGLTNEGVKQIGATVAATLEDFCMAGCFKVTDLGLMLVSFPKLQRLNYCGSYKVTDASRRYILSQNPTLLIYNGVRQFGKLAGHALTKSKLAGEGVRRGTFYDSDSCGEEEEAGGKEGEEKGFEDFKKTIGM
ncbi:hypothetical protein TL16_g12410 [Triparma laevis f. inornata]|uniref:Uncharacterized protein n=1 Tax=Triparma laevis f. inornata TaxID=1714386 RepID=A0A9W7BK29_9STRA|nr:hypothetical protein TL16_g12410 [Triparma laevis f. inornata]